MFAQLLKIIRARTGPRVLLVGAVAAAALALAVAGPASALILGHTLFGAGQRTSVVGPDASDPDDAAGNGPIAGPDTQAGAGSDPTHGKSHKTTCPAGGVPAPGTTINGGLVVDGNCTITSITVNGGVLIKGTGHLTLYKSTVNGGVHAEPRGEFDSNSPAMPGGANTLNGGVSAKRPIDMDLVGGTIRGRLVFFGQSPPAPGFIDRFTVCGVHIQGDVTLEHLATAPNGANIGDPSGEADDFAALCDGNTISGSVRINDNPGSRIELEANSIGGSVEIFNSEPSVTGNTIGGSLQCHEHARLHHWDSDDTNINTVHGANHCS